jgi:hypothetical protein
MRCALAVLIALLLFPATASAADDIPTAAATPVTEYAGTIVFSVKDTDGYHLTIQRAGGEPERLAVAPRDAPFDADIGPDSNGSPELIYSRCDNGIRHTGCDLYVLSLSAGATERPVDNANASESDLAPTLWKGRIAWARVYPGDTGAVVYTKTLTAPRSQRSKRLPGVPQKRNGAATNSRQVEALELYGTHLAEAVRYGCERNCSGLSTTEVRMADTSSGSAEQVAIAASGLSGQSWIGPSFHDGRLGFYKACLGDPSGCNGDVAGPFRYRYSKRTYEKTSGPHRVDGFADAGDALWETQSCDGGDNTGCHLVRVTPLAYASTKPPR